MEFEKFITIEFDDVDGRKVNHKCHKESMEIFPEKGLWGYWFNEGGRTYEVWGGLDKDGEPATGDYVNDGSIIPFAVISVSFDDEQIDSIDVVECE